MQLQFTHRADMRDFEWELTQSYKNRVNVDREKIRELSKRSNMHGAIRVALFLSALCMTGYAAIIAARHHWVLTIPFLYAYWFFYGFLVALGHELQHKMVFRKSWERFSEFIYFWVQTCMWNSPRYARISHRLHHRYTMVRDVDPETDWPEVITTKWLRKHLIKQLLDIFVIGAPFTLAKEIKRQIDRSLGKKDRMMREQCSDKDNHRIRRESIVILCIHITVMLASVYFKTIWPLLFITLAWQIGGAVESLWHATEHIGRPYNVNDQRLSTRSISVNPLIRLLYGGLDDHVDHHLFPAVPSKNLPKLHRLLERDIAPTRSLVGCWREMFTIAGEKDKQPNHEHVPINCATQ